MPENLTPEEFQLTRLMRGVTSASSDIDKNMPISTHTPHARRDALDASQELDLLQFQLTRLMRGVTVSSVFNVPELIFQLTRLMRGVTQELPPISKPQIRFQLTRLMRGVTFERGRVCLLQDISTHTPHARRDK